MNDLRSSRQRKGLTLGDLSELCGITLNNLSFLERGLHSPRKSTREAIEEILGKVDWKLTKQIAELKREYGDIKIEVQDDGVTFVRGLRTKPMDEY